MQNGRIGLLAAACVWAWACGGGQAETHASAGPTSTASASAAAPSASAPSDAASSSAAAASAPSASAAPSATASAAPSASATASAAPPEEADTCGPPAVPFEQALRPKVKRCFFKALAKKPGMTGHVRVTLRVDTKGHVKKIEIKNPKDPKDLSAQAVACMKKVTVDAHFDGSKCPGKAVILNMAFGAAARE